MLLPNQTYWASGEDNEPVQCEQYVSIMLHKIMYNSTKIHTMVTKTEAITKELDHRSLMLRVLFLFILLIVRRIIIQ